MKNIGTEEPSLYGSPPEKPETDIDTQIEDAVIAQALKIIEGRFRKPLSGPLNRSELVAKYFTLKIRTDSVESLWGLAMDSMNQVVKIMKFSQGSVNAATIYPREVIREIIDTKASSMILVHNHPTGFPAPSMQDREITEVIKAALKTVDICLLDHLIIGDSAYSFRDNGLLK